MLICPLLIYDVHHFYSLFNKLISNKLPVTAEKQALCAHQDYAFFPGYGQELLEGFLELRAFHMFPIPSPVSSKTMKMEVLYSLFMQTFL